MGSDIPPPTTHLLSRLYEKAKLPKDHEELAENLKATSQKILDVIEKEEFLDVLHSTTDSKKEKQAFYASKTNRIKKQVFGLNTRLFGLLFKRDAENIARAVFDYKQLEDQRQEDFRKELGQVIAKYPDADPELIIKWNQILLSEDIKNNVKTIADEFWKEKKTSWQTKMETLGFEENLIKEIIEKHEESFASNDIWAWGNKTEETLNKNVLAEQEKKIQEIDKKITDKNTEIKSKEDKIKKLDESIKKLSEELEKIYKPEKKESLFMWKKKSYGSAIKDSDLVVENIDQAKNLLEKLENCERDEKQKKLMNALNKCVNNKEDIKKEKKILDELREYLLKEKEKPYKSYLKLEEQFNQSQTSIESSEVLEAPGEEELVPTEQKPDFSVQLNELLRRKIYNVDSMQGEKIQDKWIGMGNVVQSIFNQNIAEYLTFQELPDSPSGDVQFEIFSEKLLYAEALPIMNNVLAAMGWTERQIEKKFVSHFPEKDFDFVFPKKMKVTISKKENSISFSDDRIYAGGEKNKKQGKFVSLKKITLYESTNKKTKEKKIKCAFQFQGEEIANSFEKLALNQTTAKLALDKTQVLLVSTFNWKPRDISSSS